MLEPSWTVLQPGLGSNAGIHQRGRVQYDRIWARAHRLVGHRLARPAQPVVKRLEGGDKIFSFGHDFAPEGFCGTVKPILS